MSAPAGVGLDEVDLDVVIYSINYILKFGYKNQDTSKNPLQIAVYFHYFPAFTLPAINIASQATW